MPTIHRYIFKELVKSFLISVATLTALLYLERLLYMTTLIFNRGATFVEVALMMVYISPAFLSVTIPMSVLVASVAVFNRFSSDSEIHAMKASGWSFMYLMRPVILFSIAACMVSSFVIFAALPWGNSSLQKTVFDMVRHRANFNIKPKVFNRDFSGLVLYVKGKNSATELNDVFISWRLNGNETQTALAKSASIAADADSLKIQLRLREGTLHLVSQNNKNYRTVKFDRYDLTLSLPGAKKIHQGLVGNREKSYGWVKEHIARLKKEGKPTFRWEMINSKKFALAASCLLFGLIGAPLGIKSSRAGKSGGYAISLFLLTAYFIGLISLQNLGSKGIINPVISVWIPNIIFLILAIYIARKAQKEIPYKFFAKVFDLLAGWQESARNIYLKLTFAKTAPASHHASSASQDDAHKISRQALRQKFRNIKSPKRGK